MPKVPKFNKLNAALNKEWGQHQKKSGKQHTSSRRRQQADKIIREELEDKEFYKGSCHRNKKKKEWVIEEQMITSGVWKRRTWSSRYRTLAAARKSIEYWKKKAETGDFWYRWYGDRRYRIKNVVTGEIVSC